MRIVGWSLLAAALVLVIVGLVTGQLRHHADYGVFGFHPGGCRHERSPAR